MKAIVLTYDRNRPFCEHMIRKYEEIWPSHPFEFLIPFQDASTWETVNHIQSRIKLVKTPIGIKDTVLRLIKDLPDSEWIYWCIDDKYPISLNIKTIEPCLSFIERKNKAFPCFKGLAFCRCRKLLNDENIIKDDTLLVEDDIELIRRANYYQFWIHQPMRVEVLRKTFQKFPNHHFVAKDMDIFTGQQPGHGPVLEFEETDKMYVVRDNAAVFGESTSRGQATTNCIKSMQKLEIAITNEFKIIDRVITMGDMPKTPFRNRN